MVINTLAYIVETTLPLSVSFSLVSLTARVIFAKHPVIFVCLLTISILSLTLVFITECYIPR